MSTEPTMAAPCDGCGGAVMTEGTVIEGGVVSPSDAGGVMEAPVDSAVPATAPPATSDPVPNPPAENNSEA